MKKSEQYKIAQMLVVDSKELSAEEKLEMLKTLMEDESLALYRESQEDAK